MSPATTTRRVLTKVAWVTITRRDVQAGHNAESQGHAHHLRVLAAEPE